MKGISISMQLECECGELVDAQPEAKGIPSLKHFVMECLCGKKFFVHIQESKKDVVKQP